MLSCGIARCHRLLYLFVATLCKLGSAYEHSTSLWEQRHEERLSQSCVSEKLIIDTIFSNYTKHKLPTADGVKIDVDIWVQEITSVSEISSDFEIDIYINELWFDPALRFEHLM